MHITLGSQKIHLLMLHDMGYHLTLKQVALLLDTSPQQVQNLERRALSKMRKKCKKLHQEWLL